MGGLGPGAPEGVCTSAGEAGGQRLQEQGVCAGGGGGLKQQSGGGGVRPGGPAALCHPSHLTPPPGLTCAPADLRVQGAILAAALLPLYAT